MGPLKSILVVLFCVCTSRFYGQSENQRLAADETEIHTLGFGLTAATDISVLSGYQNTVHVDAGASLSYFYKSRLFLGAYMPFIFLLQTAKGLPPFFVADFRDPIASAGAILPLKTGKLRIGAEYSYPLGRRGTIAAFPGAVAGGTDYHKIGLSTSFSKISDPIVVLVSFKYSRGFTRRSAYAQMVRPGDFNFGISITEVINYRVAFSFSAAQAISLPTVIATSWSAPDAEYSLELSASLFLTGSDGRIGFGVSKRVDSYFQKAVSILDAYYEIDW